MEPSAFFYVPLTLPSPPFWGRGLRRELSRTIKVRGHELSIRRSIIYTNLNNYNNGLNDQNEPNDINACLPVGRVS